MKYILGIDLGTQSVKAGLLCVETMRLEHLVSCGYPGAPLQEPEVLWRGTVDAIRQITASAPDPEIAGIGISGQMHGTVLYDVQDNIIGPVINWQDERGNEAHDAFDGASAVEYMNSLIDEEDARELGVDVLASGFTGVTLFHIMKTDRELFDRTAHVLLPTDFLRRRLTGGGDYVTDPTNAFSTGLFNTMRNRWSSEVIDALGLPPAILPKVVPTDEVTGGVHPGAAAATGLAPGTPVICGGGDNQMCMIGSGVFDTASPIMLNIGTSGQFCAVTGSYKKIAGIDTRSFINGLFAYVGAGLTGGMAYTWLRDSLLDDIRRLGLELDGGNNLYAVLDTLAAGVDSGCDGLEFSPLLRGTRRNPSLRASFSGISLNNFSLGHRARAVMEGVVTELYGFYKLCGELRTASITGAGNGLVESCLWRSITARVFELPLNVMDFENAVYGAALVAAQGLGLAGIEDGRFDFSFSCDPG